MMPLGVVIANEWGGARQESLYDLHRSLGALLILIVVARLIWRWMHPPLPLPDDIAAIQRADNGFWLVRSAADLAGEPRTLRAAFFRPQSDGYRHRLPCSRAYRCSALPSFRAQGSRPHAYDHRLIVGPGGAQGGGDTGPLGDLLSS